MGGVPWEAEQSRRIKMEQQQPKSEPEPDIKADEKERVGGPDIRVDDEDVGGPDIKP
jgi:hypothetical protein